MNVHRTVSESDIRDISCCEPARQHRGIDHTPIWRQPGLAVQTKTASRFYFIWRFRV